MNKVLKDKEIATDWTAGYAENAVVLSQLNDENISDGTVEKVAELEKNLRAGNAKVFNIEKEALDTYYDSLGCTLGEALLAPTKIYVKALRSIKEAGVTIKACSHITGGGFYENVPRMLKEGTRAVIRKDSYPIPPIFAMLAKEGEIEEKMMYNTFNMGLGMVLAVDEADVDKTMEAIKAAGEAPYVVGHIEEGEKGVTLC